MTFAEHALHFNQHLHYSGSPLPYGIRVTNPFEISKKVMPIVNCALIPAGLGSAERHSIYRSQATDAGMRDCKWRQFRKGTTWFTAALKQINKYSKIWNDKAKCLMYILLEVRFVRFKNWKYAYFCLDKPIKLFWYLQVAIRAYLVNRFS